MVPQALLLDEIFSDEFHRVLSKHKGGPSADSIVTNWRQVMSKMALLGGASLGSNQLTLFFDTADAWRCKWDAMDAAQHSIRFDVYQIDPDFVGKKTLQKLLDACRRGVKVILVYDSFGSHRVTLGQHVITPLRKAGATVVEFNPPFGAKGKILRRNHRKSLTVDEIIGFCGGLNATDDFCGEKEGGTGLYRDTHLKLQGPCIADLTTVFRDSFKTAETTSKLHQGHLHRTYFRTMKWLAAFREIFSGSSIFKYASPEMTQPNIQASEKNEPHLPSLFVQV